MKNVIKNKAYIFIFLIVSIFCSAIVAVLYYNKVLSSGMEVIPHIITVSSIAMAVITLVLTILMSIREGKVYKHIRSHRPDILSQVYGYTISSLVSSFVSIILSIIVLMTKDAISNCAIYKYACIILLSQSFIYMTMSATMSFFQSIQMLRLDDDEEENRSL